MRVSTFLPVMLVGLVVAITATYTAAEENKYRIAVKDGKLRAIYLVPLSTFQAYKGSVEQSKNAPNTFKIQFDANASCPPSSGTGDAARIDRCEIGASTPVETKVTTEPFCILLDNTATTTEAKIDLAYAYECRTSTVAASIMTTATLALSASLMHSYC
ncbi:hypothetical protein BDF22DRAFT_667444 [Syncephalis plumigaleata]|nr:hypothetical protein BDF22DRAFT_667444 [Syncephalis plumigaleata]